MVTVFGYKIDPAEKVAAAKNYATDLKPRLPAPTPGDVDLRNYCVSMDQYQLSSCAANATAESIEILNNIAGLPAVLVSRLFIYANARNDEPDPNNAGQTMLGQDAGTYVSLCFDSLSRFGVCDETIWPYDQTKVFTSPSLLAQRQAVGHRIHSYYRIDSLGTGVVADVISALQQNHPVVFGTNIEQSFMNVSDLTPVGPPKGVTIGGHAMCIVGYIAGKGFIVKNSWGTGWGDGGFCIMTEDYISWGETTDLWVPTLGLNLAS